MKENLPLIVVYHADCIDGAGAAWAVSKSDMATNRQVSYIPYEHADYATGETAVQKYLSRESDVVFVDVAPRRTFMKILLADKNVRHVTVLDHHKTAAEKYADFPPSDRLTMNVEPKLPSAAKMVWCHLMPKSSIPDVIAMIDKMDGDATGLVSNDDFAAAAYIDEQGVGDITEAFTVLNKMEKLSFKQMADLGAPWVAEHDMRLEAVIKAPSFALVSLSHDTAPVQVPMIEADVRDFGRGISHKLVVLGKEQGPDVSFCWRKVGEGVYVSIRTDGNPDASRIAEHFCKTMGVTGGGHATAAAIHFSSMDEFSRHFPTKKPPFKLECPRP